MSRLRDSIKNYWHYIILIIYFGLLVYQHFFIHMYGDDYYYGTFLQSNFLQKHMDHYMYTNGRALVHFIVSLMLFFKTKLFMIVNPIMIIATIILVAKLATNDEKNYKIAIASGIVLFSMLSINITRESVFWLDGSFNYLLPILLSLLTIYLLRKSINTNEKYWYLPLVGFISGMTVEQGSAITFGGVLLLILNSKFIERHNINFNHYLTLFFSLLGGLTVFLAPGNLIRMSIEKSDNSVLDNIKNIVFKVFLYKDTQVYILLLIMCVILSLSILKKHNLFSKLLIAINGVFFILFLNLGGKYIGLMPVDIEDKYTLIIVIMGILAFMAGLIYVSLDKLIVEKSEIFIISLILGFGAQIMMIVSPIYGYRILLSTIILFFIPIISTIIEFKDNRYMWIMIVVILSIYFSSTKLVLISLGLMGMEFVNNHYNYRKWIKNINSILAGTIIIAITFLYISSNINGYRTNHYAHVYNEKVIEEYFEEGAPKGITIILKKMPLYDYGWSYPYVNPYHMRVMKMYYGIDQETTVKFIP
ncbi:MAG: hypothetical protein FH761_08240 [Firmicutes bacterium]|nr:hypothetical protein [Bacillota bacterium]